MPPVQIQRLQKVGNKPFQRIFRPEMQVVCWLSDSKVRVSPYNTLRPQLFKYQPVMHNGDACKSQPV